MKTRPPGLFWPWTHWPLMHISQQQPVFDPVSSSSSVNARRGLVEPRHDHGQESSLPSSFEPSFSQHVDRPVYKELGVICELQIASLLFPAHQPSSTRPCPNHPAPSPQSSGLTSFATPPTPLSFTLLITTHSKRLHGKTRPTATHSH